MPEGLHEFGQVLDEFVQLHHGSRPDTTRVQSAAYALIRKNMPISRKILNELHRDRQPDWTRYPTNYEKLDYMKKLKVNMTICAGSEQHLDIKDHQQVKRWKIPGR